MLPSCFIGSSVESLPIANAIQENLQNFANSTIWNQGIFTPSETILGSILQALDRSDFGIFILGANDLTTLRGQNVKTPRDNIIFELGLYIGRLGLSHTFFMVPSDIKDLHLPTDLLGIVPLEYSLDREDNILANISPACNKIRRELEKAKVTARASGRSGEVTILSHVNEGSRFASECVKKAETIRVVGTARQDVINGENIANSYLKATEERFNSELPLIYRRITSSQITTPFKQHLSKLFEISKRQGTKNKFEVALAPNLDIAVSYMIFDEASVLIVVDNIHIANVIDNKAMLWSSDVEVVKAFMNHFDQAWDKLPIKIQSKTALAKVNVRK
jgi:hypothetical protein